MDEWFSGDLVSNLHLTTGNDLLQKRQHHSLRPVQKSSVLGLYPYTNWEGGLNVASSPATPRHRPEMVDLFS